VSQELEPYEPDPWERQPGEPDKAWQAFQIYRDMPPGLRSISATAKTLGKGSRGVYDMAERAKRDGRDWHSRVEAFDRENDRRERAELEEERRRANARHRQAASGAHGLAMRRLFGDREHDGLDPFTLDVDAAIALLREGFKQERVTLGMATDLLGQTGQVSAREVSSILDAMVAAAFQLLPEDQHDLYLETVRAIAASRQSAL
jgi:hypothetical protein